MLGTIRGQDAIDTDWAGPPMNVDGVVGTHHSCRFFTTEALERPSAATPATDGGKDGPIRNPLPRRPRCGGSLPHWNHQQQGCFTRPQASVSLAFTPEAATRKTPLARPLRACPPSIGVGVRMPAPRMQCARSVPNARQGNKILRLRSAEGFLDKAARAGPGIPLRLFYAAQSLQGPDRSKRPVAWKTNQFTSTGRQADA